MPDIDDFQANLLEVRLLERDGGEDVAGRGEGEPRAEATRNYYKTLKELDAFLESLGYLKATP